MFQQRSRVAKEVGTSQTRRERDLAPCLLQIQTLSLPYLLTARDRHLVPLGDRGSSPEAQAQILILAIEGEAVLGNGIKLIAALTLHHQIDLNTGNSATAGVLTADLAALVWDEPIDMPGKDPEARTETAVGGAETTIVQSRETKITRRVRQGVELGRGI
jgi:hypothetical protein